MMPPSSPNPTRRVIEIAGIALLYYGAASLGLPLAWGNTDASPVWPSAGIAFAAVLWLGSRVWPGVAVGAFLANVETFLRNQAATPAPSSRLRRSSAPATHSRPWVGRTFSV